MDCAALIPCHNEAETIGPLVGALKAWIPTILVVDDGSTDPTSEVARSAGAEVLRLPANRGKGAAIQEGLQLAGRLGMKWVLLLDGDGQHVPEDVPAFLAAIPSQRADLIIGNRMGSPANMPPIRRVTNRVMSALLSRLTGRGLPDTQCGYRLIRLAQAPVIPAECTGFEIESEMLLASLAAGLRVEFVPVQCRYTGSRSRILPVRDTARWVRWLWRSRRKFRAAGRHARAHDHLPRATDTAIPSTCPAQETPMPSASSFHQYLPGLPRILLRAVGFMSMAFLMGTAMDWSARRTRPDFPAGFWWGMAHGALMPATLPTLLTGRDVAIYAPHNTGVPYKLGYTMGVNGCGLLFFGLAFWKPKQAADRSR